jgi:hypothetical protein
VPLLFLTCLLPSAGLIPHPRGGHPPISRYGCGRELHPGRDRVLEVSELPHEVVPGCDSGSVTQYCHRCKSVRPAVLYHTSSLVSAPILVSRCLLIARWAAFLPRTTHAFAMHNPSK